MSIVNHPLLTHDFQREIAIAASTDSEVKAKVHPAFSWLAANSSNKLTLKTYGQCTHFKPTPGLETKASHHTSPPPGGPDQCIVIIVGRDTKGKLRACASNAIPKPVKTDGPCPVKFFEEFDALRSTPAHVQLLHQAISSVATKDHVDWVERVYKEGQRYRTSPVFLVVLDGDTQHFYATTALVEGPPQTDRSLEWTGRVAA